MTVILWLNDARLDRVGWRLDSGRKFTIAVPERRLRLHRSEVCLLVADNGLVWEGDGWAEDEDAPGRSIIGVARIRSSPRPTTTDDRVMITDSLLVDSLQTARVVRATAPKLRNAVSQAMRAEAVVLSGESEAALMRAIAKLRPGLAETIEEMRGGDELPPVSGATGETLVLERDAARLALSIAGLDPSGLSDIDAVSEEGFLSSLAYETPEDAMVSHDAGRFPAWMARPGGRPDWLTFSDGDNHMRIGNVNKTKLENVLGVDLIYHHIEADTLVLVQYKRMRKDAQGEWFYRTDDQLEKELVRMRKVDAVIAMEAFTPRTWRLHPRGCLLKLVRQPKQFDPRSDQLLQGIYLPLEYLDGLLADPCTQTKGKSRRLGYDTIDRYLTNDLFVSLVRQGWIGTRGATTKAVSAVIDAAVRGGRSVIVAEEWGEATGAKRRRRPVAE